MIEELREKLRVRGTPELIADLEGLARKQVDTQELTDYAVDQGVELPDFYDSLQQVSMHFSMEDGVEIEHGLFWDDPDEM